MKAPIPLALTLSALMSVAQAQIVSPDHFSVAEAPSSDLHAFGQSSSNGWRLLQVHDDLNGQARTFNSLALRRDSTSQRQKYNTYTLQMTVLVSTAATTASTISTTFDANHGANKQTVVNTRDIQLPTTAPGEAPAAFDYRIPFDQPYAFDGAGPLCWEVRILNATNLLTNYYFDAASSSSTNPPLANAVFGEGCQHSTRLSPIGITGSSSMVWSQNRGTLRMNGSDLPTNTIAFAALGISRTNFNGLPLPFLLPGTLTAWSGPCRVYASLDIVSPTPTTTSGTAAYSVPVPAQLSFHGLQLYGQYLATDVGSGTPLGLTTSPGVEYNWVAPYSVAPISQIYVNQLFGTTGTKRANFGYVVQLR